MPESAGIRARRMRPRCMTRKTTQCTGQSAHQ